ncbi:PD-(D/E)XK nuclease family protein [Pelagibaculum spongiae]|uniref:PD-(D/E)XK nuclease superfamily protein n=1 Tax=Pelagibaculum spongiae TaxID=2080658 RepID=A0A2V1H4R1_9GAMM|nr:PD-(D/E)XK nuclease family protein [Pelagibaculum spongiae]PVZ70626.1 hypothetical protein DC094_08600 [Pelagibaculum spongiae]
MEQNFQKLLLSNHFMQLDSFSSEFDLFKMMGVRNKELIHSNIIACLLNPSYPHGLGHAFLNAFTRGVSQLELIESSARAVPLSALIAATDNQVIISRELENIDLVIEYPQAKLVVAIENKIWAGEQKEQILRYQKILTSRYSGYTHALIYLTPNGKPPTTDDTNSSVPVYLMSYGQMIDQLAMVKSRANQKALFFIEQFSTHVEQYMSGSNEIRDLCWNIFEKHEDAYQQMAKHLAYCVQRKIENFFEKIEGKLNSDSMFSEFDGMEIISAYRERENKDHFDLNIRLQGWPEGLYIKIYKHSWFAVFPFVEKENLNKVKALLCAMNSKATKVSAWQGKYYVSKHSDLDSRRKILEQGNEISEEHINSALNKVREHIIEINKALN